MNTRFLYTTLDKIRFEAGSDEVPDLLFLFCFYAGSSGRYHLLKNADLNVKPEICPLCGGNHIVSLSDRNYTCHDCHHNLSITYCNDCDPQKARPIIWVKYVDDKFLQREDVVRGDFSNNTIYDQMSKIEIIMGEKATTSFDLFKEKQGWKLKTICPHCGVRLGEGNNGKCYTNVTGNMHRNSMSVVSNMMQQFSITEEPDGKTCTEGNHKGWIRKLHLSAHYPVHRYNTVEQALTERPAIVHDADSDVIFHILVGHAVTVQNVAVAVGFVDLNGAVEGKVYHGVAEAFLTFDILISDLALVLIVHL